MPYVRKGRKVYTKAGKLVGESKNIECAKRYMKALYANVPDAREKPKSKRARKKR